MNHPESVFHSHQYLRHNARRLEHLASLRIDVSAMSVIEVGAGIGDHSEYYLDRGCDLMITEVRKENVEILHQRFNKTKIAILDMNKPKQISASKFDIAHCYGLLYHLDRPELAINYLSKNVSKHLFLETCVSFGNEENIYPVKEDRSSPSQAFSGNGCRPTRPWIFNRLKESFEFVYVPKTQPHHSEFPLDWTAPELHSAKLQRAVFIGSHVPLSNSLLSSEIPDIQTR